MNPARKPASARIALVALLLTAGLAYAVAEHYDVVRMSTAGSVIVAHRTAFSADDSATTVAPIDPQQTFGNPTVVAAPRFSNSGATALVEVWLYQRTGSSGAYVYTLLGVSARQTATASTTLRNGAAGNYLLHTPLFFDTCGADVYDVRARTISAGTLESFAWSVGIQSRAAE